MIAGKLLVRPGLVLGLTAFAVSLAGCGRKSDSDQFGQLSIPANSSSAQSQFGDRFAQAASADPNSEPMNVTDRDLPPVDPTKEPVEVR